MQRSSAQDPDARRESDPELVGVIELHFYVIRRTAPAPRGTE